MVLNFINNTDKYFSLPDQQLAENLIIFWFLLKRQIKCKNKANFVEVIITIFSYKNTSQTVSKTFVSLLFSLIT